VRSRRCCSDCCNAEHVANRKGGQRRAVQAAGPAHDVAHALRVCCRRHASCYGAGRTRRSMIDLLLMLLTLAFFAVSIAYLRACGRI
jgi:hypothetical protein